MPDGRDNPFADVKVRQAFSMAVNKQTIVTNITRLGEQPARTYVPLGIFPKYESPEGLPFDVKRAGELLAEAGYPQGRSFPRVSLLYNNEGSHAEIAQYVRRQWLENLGVEVDLEGVEIKVFTQRLHGKTYAVARASWIGDYNDPSTYVAEQRLYESPNTAIQLSPVRWEPPQLEFQHHFPMYGLKLRYE